MKKLKKAVLAVLSAVLVVGNINAVFADGDISVRMNGIVSNDVSYINFTDTKPIQIDNRTLTPARAMAEAAGMEVEWDQPTQTALLTLKADANSDRPIERFASEAINKIDGLGLDMTPTSITAALRLNDSNAVIRYNFTDSDGDNVPFGKDYEMVSQAVFIEDGTLMIPIRDSMEMFGLDIEWYQDELCAEVNIPEEIDIPEGLAIIPNHGNGKYSADNLADNSIPSIDIEDVPVDNDQQLGTYLGKFKITHYCPCSICNGGWGAYTAWAGELIPDQTIAVNPKIIPKLSWVYVDGYGYRHAEDTGSGIGEYHIDMAVPTHSMAVALGVVYKDVYLVE